MFYVLRNAQGQICSVHVDAVPGAEVLPQDHPQVRAFFNRADTTSDGFARLDAGLVRVLEDLIDALLERNILRITDLPPEAQQKLIDRKTFRSRFQHSALNLFGNEMPGAEGSHGDTLPPLL